MNNAKRIPGSSAATPAATLSAILKLEVPIVVQLGERRMGLREVLALSPGAIIEIPRNAEAELELRVHNKTIGCGNAVKVGENFGLQVTYIGDVRDRIAALGATSNTESPAEEGDNAAIEASIQAILGGR
jgi:flagellar motor switch protein FliN/FliY